jgi:hypothetical protein
MLLATSDNDAAIAVFVCFFLFGGPVFGFVALRWMKHRERMALISRGVTPPGMSGYQAPPSYVPGPMGQTVFIPDPGCQVTLHKGIRMAAVGFALLIGLSLIGFHDGEWRPGPWLLGGLVPLFVGLSQIAIAVLSGAQITVPQWQRYGAPQEPPLYSVPNPPGGTGTPPPSGPYTYRPPGDVPEIPKSNQPRPR